MKRFRYQWKLGEKETQGAYQCEDQEALREHLNKIGGQLIEILEESDIAEKQTLPAASPTVQEEKPAVCQPFGSGTYNLLKKCPETAESDIVIKIWGWFQIITGAGALVMVLIFGTTALLTGGEMTWQDVVLTSAWQKLVLMVVLALVCAVGFFLGFAILTFHVIAARFLLFFAGIGILTNILWLISGNMVRGAFWMVFYSFIIWHLLRQRKRS